LQKKGSIIKEKIGIIERKGEEKLKEKESKGEKFIQNGLYST
jgi:hypothetical protein